MKNVILFFVLMSGVSFFASAQSGSKVIKTQVKQSSRIIQGLASGELTKHEVKQLKKQQRHIQKEKRIARADGIVTRRERAHIRHDQKVANRSIYGQKHDVQNRL